MLIIIAYPLVLQLLILWPKTIRFVKRFRIKKSLRFVLNRSFGNYCFVRFGRVDHF